MCSRHFINTNIMIVVKNKNKRKKEKQSASYYFTKYFLVAPFHIVSNACCVTKRTKNYLIS